jgi:NAD(P)-dependent dehydrogenase (short-subunit alcohol dehydrogenase family)
MPAPDLDGRIALITGAAGGIGQPLARAFVDAGMRVALCDTSAEGVRRLHVVLQCGLGECHTFGYRLLR